MKNYNYNNYRETKERKLERETMTISEQKEMCEMFGGVWVQSYRKGHIEVAGYCRSKSYKKVWR